MLKADLHIHTAYSIDSAMPPEKVVARCLEVGINCIAVTDHNNIVGGQKTQQIAPFSVIVGEEILTTSGEIIGLFLTKEVPRGLSVGEAVARVKDQGGLVGVPHPFDRLRLSALKDKALESLLTDIDFIEVFNSRTIMLRDSARAQHLAQRHGIPASAGSDAHIPSEVGRAYVEMPEFNGQDGFLQSLMQGRVFGHRSTPLVHFATIWARLRSRF